MQSARQLPVGAKNSRRVPQTGAKGATPSGCRTSRSQNWKKKSSKPKYRRGDELTELLERRFQEMAPMSATTLMFPSIVQISEVVE